MITGKDFELYNESSKIHLTQQGNANLGLLQSQLGKNHCKLSTMVGKHFEMTVL